MSVTKNLEDIGKGVWAYTQLPGSWGWSNTGLIVDGDESLLVDTLFDLKATGEMLTAMRRASESAARIDIVVNTHGNGDHCYGNALVQDAEIWGTKGCVRDLADTPPKRNALFLRAGRVVHGLGPLGRGLGTALRAVGVPQLAWLAEAAPFALPTFDAFDFPTTEAILPNNTFEGSATLHVGDKRVELVEVGPAHTLGDAFVYVPEDRVVFTGDLLFQEAHPIVWEGPVANWIAALRRLGDLEVDTVVPGHGPVTDKSGLRGLLDYFETLTKEAKRCYEAGMPAEQAALEISLDAYRDWLDGERIYVNVRTLYRDFAGDREAPDVLELFAGMARHRKALTRR